MINNSLNTYELGLVTDMKLLITKNEIIQKVYHLFGNLAEVFSKEICDKILASQNFINPKISRGENYLGLPYVILDYPRQFGKKDIFAVRCFFWWGNFFSITLHLAGQYKLQYGLAVQRGINNNYFSGWYLGTENNQWEHHFESDNYRPLLAEEKVDVSKLPFIKLAKKIPLEKWDEATLFFYKNFSLLIKTINYAPIL